MPDSPGSPAPGQHRRGALAWMARNSVAANLLMFILLVGGILSGIRLKQEVFPEFSMDAVEVRVAYPGASPKDVEQGIILAVEEAVRGVEGVKRVDSTAREGTGTVKVNLLLDADPDQVLADVKSEVDRITTFPEQAEEPTISLAKNRRQVISLVIAGDERLRVLHEIAEDARTDLLATGEVTQIDLEGVPPLEIAIEIPREVLEKHVLTLQEVANQISRASLELPGGAIETQTGEILVRVAERRRVGHELTDVIVARTAEGAEVRLGDIAQIHDGYEDIDQYGRYDGETAVRMNVYRVGDQTPTAVAKTVKDYAQQLRAELPDNVTVDVWQDQSEILSDRMNLLMKNAATGLVLVVLVLALFLDLRLAFWVSLGIPISFLGALLVLGPADISINMVTTFAFIVTLGMVVDDAIVVGERTFAMREKGLPPVQAAVAAVREMAMPVTFAILTTVAAFAPLFFVPGTMGKIFRLIPAVVISVLLLSLIESFFVLPAHLAHAKKSEGKGLMRPVVAIQAQVARGLAWFTQRLYRPSVERAVAYRYLTVAIAVGTLLLTIGFVASGRLPFNFFPPLEGDIVKVQARLPYGTPLKTTEEVGQTLLDSAHEAIDDFGGPQVVRGVYTRVGQEAPAMGPDAGDPETGSHIVSIEINLQPVSERDFTGEAFLAKWQGHTPEIPGLESLSFDAATGPGAGAAVAVQLGHEDVEVLAEASRQMKTILDGYDELKNVRNEYAEGKPQLDFHLRPEARALGLTANDIAMQIRAAFYGAEALRDQRERNELKIMVRLPLDQRRSEYDLSRLMITTPAGGYVPLGYVADFERGKAATSIRREDSRRHVTVTAELAPGVESPRPVLSDLEETKFEALRESFPELTVRTVGQQREQQETFKALGQNYILGMFVIFALLAVPFRSYVQPLIVMAVIPLGFIGAIAGHVLTGHSLSLMSMFGLVALSGVVVNDSLVLIDATNRLRAEGKSPGEAIIEGGTLRFRAILLTSLTTFFGLVPIIAETSIQAQFLIPMAVSLGFGVLFVTFIVLLVVPALYMIAEDARRLVR